MSQITTHILDTAAGRPAAGVPLELARREGEHWVSLATGTTDADGRVAGLLGEETLPAGTYRMHFDTAQYFRAQGSTGFVQVELFSPGSHGRAGALPEAHE